MKNKIKKKFSLKRMIIIAISMISGFYIILLILLYVFQDSLIFYPSSEIIATPKSYGLDFEDVIFETSDNIKLSGWFVPCQQNKTTILFCHGNAGNISGRIDFIYSLHNLGYNVFIFDYRSFGRSQGKISEQGTYLDASAAWDFLVTKKKIKPNEIVILGRSLGGSIAANLASKKNPKALILDSTFTSLAEKAGERFPYVPAKLLLKFEYNTLEFIKKVQCPLLVMHSKNDELLPFSYGERIFATANEPKEFAQRQGNHNEVNVSGDFSEIIEDFIANLDKN